MLSKVEDLKELDNLSRSSRPFVISPDFHPRFRPISVPYSVHPPFTFDDKYTRLPSNERLRLSSPSAPGVKQTNREIATC